MIEIRTERPEDSPAIQQVHMRAFGGPLEAKLVRLISARKKALISLVVSNDDRGSVIPSSPASPSPTHPRLKDLVAMTEGLVVSSPP